jgi:hypothetical protein
MDNWLNYATASCHERMVQICNCRRIHFLMESLLLKDFMLYGDQHFMEVLEDLDVRLKEWRKHGRIANLDRAHARGIRL